MSAEMFFTLCLLSVATFYSGTTATTDCTKFPSPTTPQQCCNFPQLFKTNVLEICKPSLEKKGSQCFYDCVFTHTEICRKGKCSRNKAEDYVDWVLPAEHPFTPVFKTAYDKCIDQVNGTRINMVQPLESVGCNPLPEMIYLCVQNEMYTLCPAAHWNSADEECAKKRDCAKSIRDE